jgi:hypothetical protein
MIYMVEMALLDTARRAEWEAWYVAHQHRLLSIPGFRASLRFEAIHAAASPFVALREVDSADAVDGGRRAGSQRAAAWPRGDVARRGRSACRRARPSRAPTDRATAARAGPGR